jgi:hypothetical protein
MKSSEKSYPKVENDLILSNADIEISILTINLMLC